MKKYAFVDVDNTVVDGNLGKELAKLLLSRAYRPHAIRNRWRFLLYMLKSFHIFILYPFSFLLPVYYYLQEKTADRFLDLVESWDPEDADTAARLVAERARIPCEAISFLNALHNAGYTVVLLSASPTIVLKHLVRRLGIPLRYVGLDEAHPYPMTADAKRRVIESEFSDGVPAVIVGNPRREPFELAKERAIIVKKPSELGRFISLFKTKRKGD